MGSGDAEFHATRFSGTDCCASGVAFLATSLITRHIPAVNDYHYDLSWRWDHTLVTMPLGVVGPMSWIGAILVMIGVGRIMFLDD